MDCWESDLLKSANDAVDAYEAKLANKAKKATTKRTNIDDDDTIQDLSRQAQACTVKTAA